MTETTAKKVLIVDDEEPLREVYAKFLESVASDVWTVRDAADAIAFLRERRDVTHVITDTQMPGMSGLEFAHIARAQYPSMNIMILSGDVGYGPTFRQAHEDGIVNAYGFKPAKMHTLRSFLQQ